MTVVFTTGALAGSDDGNSDGGSNQRVVFKASASILSAAAGANQVRVSGLWGSASPTETGTIDDFWCGRGAGSGSFDYNGNQTQLKTTGGATTFNSSAAGTFTTDWATFAAGETFDNTKDLVLAIHFKSGATGSVAFSAITGIDFAFNGGPASSAGTTAPGIPLNASNTSILITSIEMQVSGGTPIVVGQTPPRIFQPRQGPDRGMRSPKAFPASPISLALSAAQGTYTLTGQVQTLAVGMPAAEGVYSLTGFAATLSVVPNPVGLTPPRIFRPDSGPHRNMRTAKAFPTIGSNSYTLAGSQGTYTLTGFSAILNRGIQMSGGQGSYTLTGEPQTLNRGIQISGAQGSYTLNGQPVTPGVGMPAAQALYSLTGQSVTPAVGMPAAQGTYTLNGKPQAFAVALSILPQQGTYSLTGNGSVLTLTPAGGGGGVVHANPFFATPGQLMNLQ